MNQSSSLLKRIASGSLVMQIMVGLAVGVLLALVMPEWATSLSILGDLFVSGLKAVAPVLVLVLVMV